MSKLDSPMRCPWLPLQHGLYVKYHDEEWGVPVRDERALFECLCLESMQAGLSWWTVLQKREAYRKRFHGFDPLRLAELSDAEIEEAMQDGGIIRHRKKIETLRNHARAWLALEEPVEFLWGFVQGKPLVGNAKALSDYATKNAASEAMLKALKARGFSFIGSSTIYAFMQATGMIEDHSVTCFRKSEISQ